MWPFRRKKKEAEVPASSIAAEDYYTHEQDMSAAEQWHNPPAALVEPFAPPAPAISTLPQFRSNAADQPAGFSAGDAATVSKRAKLRDAFSASQPVQHRDQLVGRSPELERLIAAISEQRAHALIFGPRGYGKTSLVRSFGELADEANYLVVYTSCTHSTTLSELFRPYLAEVPLEYSSRRSTKAHGEGSNLASLLPEEFSVRQLADILGSVSTSRVIFILDEYDRVEDPVTQRQVAELIKDLSDLQARVHLVLVGVARNVQQLLGFHPSIHRNLVCVGLHRLDRGNAERLIHNGAAAAGITFDEEVVTAMLDMSGGSAYHIRLIGLHAGLAALANGQSHVDAASLATGIGNVLEEWYPLDPYGAQLARKLCEDQQLRCCIEAIALASLNHNDRFTVSDSSDEYARRFEVQDRSVTGMRLGSLCKSLATAAHVLAAAGADVRNHLTYEFVNHLTPQFLLMAAWRCSRAQGSKHG